MGNAANSAAGWLLEQETGDARDAGELAASAERLCQKLKAALREIIGGAGYDAILSRARHLAERDFPYLAALGHSDDGACLPGLDRALAGRPLEEARRALTGLFGQALQTLSSLITPEIVLEQVHRAWPGLPQPLLQAAMKEGMK